MNTPATINHRLLAAANTVNATLVQAGNVRLMRISGFNAGTVTYLKLYDKATAPDENDVPVLTIYLAASLTFNEVWPNGYAFAKGLGYRMTTAAADNSTAAVAANAVLALNVGYA